MLGFVCPLRGSPACRPLTCSAAKRPSCLPRTPVSPLVLGLLHSDMKVSALLLAMVMLVHGKALDTWKRGQLEVQVHHRPSLLWKVLWAQAKSQFLKKSPTSSLGSNTFKKSAQFVNYRDYRRSVGKRSLETTTTFKKQKPKSIGMPEVIQTYSQD